MRERFKTLLLILLVSISVFITQKLWMQIPYQILGKDEGTKTQSSPNTLADLISPNKYLLNFNDRNHTLVYDDLKYSIWDNSQGYLGELLEAKNIEIQKISKEEYISYEGKKSVIFYFSQSMNTYILSKAWEVKEPNNIVETIPNIESIYIYLGGGDPFFVLSEGENYHLLKNINIDLRDLKVMIDKIDEKKEYPYYYSMRKTLNTDNDIYIPYEMKTSLPKIYVSNGVNNLDLKERTKIAEKFLDKDIDYIREIMEGNGSNIYIHEQKVLKLNTKGTIEYFHPLNKKVEDRNLYNSLLYAADFIKNNSGMSKDIHLVDIEEIESDNNLGYKFMFRYRVKGIPVILGNNQIEEYIQMEVFNNHIRSYKYYAREETEALSSIMTPDQGIKSAFDIIDKNYEKLEKIYIAEKLNEKAIFSEDKDLVEEVLSTIDTIALAYFDPGLKEIQEKLIPVWVIGFKDQILAFDANTGFLVFERINR